MWVFELLTWMDNESIKLSKMSVFGHFTWNDRVLLKLSKTVSIWTFNLNGLSIN